LKKYYSSGRIEKMKKEDAKCCYKNDVLTGIRSDDFE
jgi:hypothetical protein